MGDVMLDCYWIGVIVCVFFEVLVLVVNINDIEDCLGGVVNVVINLVLLGVLVFLLGLVG